MPYYLRPVQVGIDEVVSCRDGYSVSLRWFQAYPSYDGYDIAYNIYYSTDRLEVFSEGAKYLSHDGYTTTTLQDLDPGQLYHFSVRPIEYNPTDYNFSLLPEAFNNLKIYPQSVLRQNMDQDDLLIPLLDTDTFPAYGIVKIGRELVRYSSVDSLNNNLIVSAISNRGIYGSNVYIHNVDGYDGYLTNDPNVYFYSAIESNLFDRVFAGQIRFEYPEYSFTQADGYKQRTADLLTTDLSGSDAANAGFPSYPFVGWHRKDPKLLLSGQCVNSYIGGEYYCADGYSGVGRKVRGLRPQEVNNQRQELLLETTGEPVTLLQKKWTGIHCSCYIPSRESPQNRCPKCYGTGFVVGYEQHFSPRRSDGRIMVRFSQGDDDVKQYEAGMESEGNFDVWTITIPTIKDRDVLIRYDINGNEEFRYEVMSVTRNKLFFGEQGAQKMRVQRIRKFDPSYQILAFRDTSKFPAKLSTSIEISNGIPLHSHEIVKNEGSASGWSQLTSVVQGHNHPVRYVGGQLVVDVVLGHTHTIVL